MRTTTKKGEYYKALVNQNSPIDIYAIELYLSTIEQDPVHI